MLRKGDRCGFVEKTHNARYGDFPCGIQSLIVCTICDEGSLPGEDALGKKLWRRFWWSCSGQILTATGGWQLLLGTPLFACDAQFGASVLALPLGDLRLPKPALDPFQELVGSEIFGHPAFPFRRRSPLSSSLRVWSRVRVVAGSCHNGNRQYTRS